MSQDTPIQKSGIGCCSKSNVSGGARPSPDTNGVILEQYHIPSDADNTKIYMIIDGGDR